MYLHADISCFCTPFFFPCRHIQWTHPCLRSIGSYWIIPNLWSDKFTLSQQSCGTAALSSQQNHSRQLIDWTLTTYCWRLIIDYTGHLVSKENEKGGAVRLKAFSLDYKVKKNVYMVNTTLRVVFIFIFELLNYSYASCWLSRPYATECTETCLFSIAWAFFHTDRTLSLTTIVYSLSDLK